MKKALPVTILFLLMIALASCVEFNSSPDWSMKQAPIMTQWAAEVRIDQPWDLYPRPYLQREEWTNLNGLWDYSITSRKSGRPDSTQGLILVPYPIESALSGVMERVDQDDLIWYHRTFTVPKFKGKEKVLLHFEAADWQTQVWIGDHLVGEHTGGYSPFCFDITEWVQSEKLADIWVTVWDPTTEGTQAAGKQNSNPHGIWYTPSSGLWQTVWLEKVPQAFITDYLVVSNIDDRSVKIRTTLKNAKDGDLLQYEVLLRGEKITETSMAFSKEVVLTIPEMELWTPDTPTLYDLKITLHRNDKGMDEIKGYFGMRKIALGKDTDGITKLFLNNEFVFQNGPLDQGFWPDGLYTPPTEEAMLYDLETLKDMGFNMLRKHVKVENRRFYYWTDKMGFLVWQDMPNAYYNRPTEKIESPLGHTAQFEKELQEMIFSLDNHPSIVMWVPFNEGWGQYETERIADFVEELDPTRLINSASGWVDKGVGHVHDIHNYPNPKAPPVEENRAIVLGEFGGLGLPIQDHTWQQDKNWGYENMTGAESLLSKYEAFYEEVDHLVKNAGLSAVVYTQTTDVEIETNGLLTYDRAVDKMGREAIRKAHFGYTAPLLKNPIQEFVDQYNLELACRKSGAKIHFTTDGSDPTRKSELFTHPITIKENCTVKAIAFWKIGETSRISTFQLQKITPERARDVNPVAGIGFKLYEGAWNKIPDFESLSPVEEGSAKVIDLSPALGRTKDFGLVFQGYLQAPETGVYQFILNSDDGARLLINNQELIVHDGIHGMGEEKGTIGLEKGFHSIEFHYFQHLGGQGLRLSWTYLDYPKSLIAPTHYFR